MSKPLKFERLSKGGFKHSVGSLAERRPISVKSTLLKSLLVSGTGVIIAYAMIWFLIPLFGEKINPSAWVLGFVGPFLIGMPLSIYCFWQADRLKSTHLQLVAAHEDLRRKSSIDPMTGMLNRETFITRLEQRRRRSVSGVLLIADADHFKRINDSYGHLEGDKALRLISAAIVSSVRDCDLVGRIGGEEFAIFLTGVDLPLAADLSEQVRIAVEALAFETSCGADVSLSISAGAAICDSKTNLSDLMRRADRCLYEAKRNGRNQVIFNQEFRKAA